MPVLTLRMPEQARQAARYPMVNVAQLCDNRRPAQLNHCIDQLTEMFSQIMDTLEQTTFVEARSKARDLRALLAKQPTPKIYVVFVGATGAGKSSLINALLCIDYFIPTDCTAACTSVPIEISYHEKETLVAQITFMQKSQWKKLLQELIDTVLQGNSAPSQNPDDEGATEADAAFSQIQAVYPWLERNKVGSTPLEQLISDERLRHLDETVLIEHDDPDLFSRELQDILGKTKGLWPLIVNVSIQVDALVLKTGVVLVDIPGLQDSNSARTLISQKYIQTTKYIFACSPCIRLVDNNVTREVIDKSLRKQMTFDGTKLNVTIIGTSTDVINLSEVTNSLGLPAKYYDLQRRQRELGRLISDLRARKDALTSQGNRKRRAPSVLQRQAKKAKGDAGRVSDTIRPYREGSMVEANETSGEDLTSITMRLADFEDEQRAITDELHHIAISARNTASQQRLRQDFEDRQRAIETAFANEKGALSEGEREKSIKKAVDSLSVHLVSSTAYQILAGNRFDVDALPGFTTLEDTGILALREHCIRLTDKPRIDAYKTFITDGIQMLNSLRSWVDRDLSSGGALSSRLQRQEKSIRTGEQQQLDKELESLFHKDVIGKVRERKADDLSNRIRSAVLIAKNRAPQTAAEWGLPRNQGGLHYMTLLAIMKRDGEHVSGARVRHDWNEELGQQLKDRLVAQWSIFFTQMIPEIFDVFATKAAALVTKFLSTFHQRNKAYGTSAHELAIVQHQLPNYHAHLENIARGKVQDIDDEQRRINREAVEPVIKEIMREAYQKWPDYGGKGARTYLTSDLENFVSDHLDMYTACERKIDRKLNELGDKHITPTLRALKEAVKTISKQCNDVGLGPGEDVNTVLLSKEDKAVKEKVASVLSVVSAALLDSANADVWDPSGLEELEEDEGDGNGSYGGEEDELESSVGRGSEYSGSTQV